MGKNVWLRLFSSQTFSRINTPTFLKSSHSSYPSAYEDGTECSETSAHKIQTPGNYQEESIQNSTPTFSNLVILHTHPPMKMDQTVCSETSACKIQTPGNYQEESIQNSTPTFSNLVILHTHPPMKMEQTVCSETSAYKIQTPGDYP